MIKFQTPFFSLSNALSAFRTRGGTLQKHAMHLRRTNPQYAHVGERIRLSSAMVPLCWNADMA